MRSSGPSGAATVAEGHGEAAAVALDAQVEPRRERIHHRHAHAVQTAGDLVAGAAELAAGVQHREHDLGGRLVRVFGHLVDRNAAAVVGFLARTVGHAG